MTQSIFSWKIGGSAGDGQQVAGLLFSKVCARNGLFIFDTAEFPSLIRGGHVTYQVAVSNQPISSVYRQTDILLALNQESIDLHLDELSDQAIILYDQNLVKKPPRSQKQRQVLGLPMPALIEQAQTKAIARNIIGLGASLAAVGYDTKRANTLLAEIFADKGEKIIALNQKALAVGHAYAQKNLKKVFTGTIKPTGKTTQQIVVTGNEAIALGALASGCKLHVHYPMSPSSSILHALVNWGPKAGMVVKQPEDEISAINTAIGGAFAGVRAMTATSGGGFALMTEGLALAGITETPVVVVVAQRPGPATGLPTWTEQGDLQFVIHAAHGEFPRIVLAPGDPEEAFYLTGAAFNLAEKYQLPVIIMMDKYISESHRSLPPFDSGKTKINRGELLTQAQLNKLKPYRRYKVTASGISPRAVPGMPGGVHLCNSDEHNEAGFSIEGWEPEQRIAQVEKRWRKLPQLLKDGQLPQPKRYGPASAQLTLVGWGSIKGPVLQALKELPRVNFIHLTAVYPLSEAMITTALKGSKKLVTIENNYQGQLADLLRAETGLVVDRRLTKYSGRQFYPEEIVRQVKKLVSYG